MSGLQQPSIAKLITLRLAKLTRAQQRMAQFVLSHPLRVATISINEFSKLTGVSVASANRFARALDLPGYPQMRAMIARSLEHSLESSTLGPACSAQPVTTAEPFVASLRAEIQNLETVLQSLDVESCTRAVEALQGAERVFVVGFGESGFLAGLLQRSLCMRRDAVELLSGVGGISDAARRLSRIRPADLLIVVDLSPTPSEASTLARSARDAGVPVMAVASWPTHLAALATISLYTLVNPNRPVISLTTALALIEALDAAFSVQKGFPSAELPPDASKTPAALVCADAAR